MCQNPLKQLKEILWKYRMPQYHETNNTRRGNNWCVSTRVRCNVPYLIDRRPPTVYSLPYSPQQVSVLHCVAPQSCCSWTSAAVIRVMYEGVLISPYPDQEGKKLQRPNSGFFQYTPHESSIHFLAHWSNFCKPLRKKFIRLSFQPGFCGSTDFRVGRKMATFQLFFQSREQVVVRRGQIRRTWWVIKTLEAQVG